MLCAFAAVGNQVDVGRFSALSPGVPFGRDILAKQLKTAGYATGMFGKGHIGQQGDNQPGKRGFDEAIVSMGQHFDFATNPKTD